MEELFSRFDIDNMTQVLRQRGKPYGITFCDITLLANSRLALEAAEFARASGRYGTMHSALFKAYFTDGRNIGDMDVLRSVAVESGLDVDGMVAALEVGQYSGRVKAGSEAARNDGVTAVPTFIIDGQPRITGAVNEVVFREALQKAAKSPSRA